MRARRRKVLRPDRVWGNEVRSPPARSVCFKHPVRMSSPGVRAAAQKVWLEIYNDESWYTYHPSDARAVRAQRGDDVRAERCLRVGRDRAALWGVLGVHVVDFTWFSPNRETSRPRLERAFWVITRQRSLLARSSGTRDVATVLGHHPRPLGLSLIHI